MSPVLRSCGVTVQDITVLTSPLVVKMIKRGKGVIFSTKMASIEIATPFETTIPLETIKSLELKDKIRNRKLYHKKSKLRKQKRKLVKKQKNLLRETERALNMSTSCYPYAFDRYCRDKDTRLILRVAAMGSSTQNIEYESDMERIKPKTECGKVLKEYRYIYTAREAGSWGHNISHYFVNPLDQYIRITVAETEEDDEEQDQEMVTHFPKGEMLGPVKIPYTFFFS